MILPTQVGRQRDAGTTQRDPAGPWAARRLLADRVHGPVQRDDVCLQRTAGVPGDRRPRFLIYVAVQGQRLTNATKVVPGRPPVVGQVCEIWYRLSSFPMTSTSRQPAGCRQSPVFPA